MTQQERDLALLALHTAAASLRRAADLCGAEVADVGYAQSAIEPYFDFHFRRVLSGSVRLCGGYTPEQLLERWSPPESVIEAQRQAAERLRLAAVEYAYGGETAQID